ncbi:phosphoesterase [Desulfurivibrio alkaliphilus]|uniref:Phosphoesterase (MutT family)-like protein n=1 Tax=Desulfurivibrio alkaliphilus (strain DSM 19089 / UNIQEM U267 / AHT2) TaxID=589865 RepID=D6Z2Z5_DESAT|nr:phosphoesterase [Desulfurivibrio alkaliphilus]ADH85920.1 phosphoesterase (MutT family)-like protein [Desulfurivibrio alkaliphilus AHT 2]
MKMAEEVFCLPRRELEQLFGGELPQGGFAGPEPERLLELPQRFIARGICEEDPSFKQLIPYQLFSFQQRFFVYRRGGGVGEGRLAGRLSVGVGGHINREDADAGGLLTAAAYRQALLRERREELVNSDGVSCRFVGWINDDDSPVGRVHLGAVHLGQMTDEQTRTALGIRAQGEDIHPEGWWSAAEIYEQEERFEKWALHAVSLVVRQRRQGAG